jgi:molecular chaperone DnaK
MRTTGTVEVIRNEDGRTTTPSIIYFGDREPIVGKAAKEMRVAQPRNVVQLFKRSMGDEHFLFSANGHDYTPVDLSALVLSYLKAQAERVLRDTVTDAVIAVPAYFTDPQRKATIQAGEQAGLRILKIISEPTAAAMAYSYSDKPAKEQTVLVYDLGGGTFDVSLVSIKGDELRVVGTDGNSRLGGADWDGRLLTHLILQIEQTYGMQLTGEEREKLIPVVEQAKHALSARQNAAIYVQIQGQAVSCTITRSQFENLTRDLLEETQMLVERLLRTTGLSWHDITTVLPVGGAARMPMVRSFIGQVTGKPCMMKHDPDEIVAIGAAIQASRDSAPSYPAGVRVTDAIAHSLGIIVESVDRARYLNSIIIPKNSPVPIARTRPYHMRLRRDGKTQLEVFLTQGESSDPQYCVYLGRYLFTDFPSHLESSATLDITYQYDQNGVVQVSAVERSSRQPLKLVVENPSINISDRFIGHPIDKVRQDRLTIYLAFDLSGSMKGEPLEAAKRAALSFVERCNLATTAVGLLSFSDRVYVNLRATHDEQVLCQEIDKLTLIRTGGGNNADPFAELQQLLEQGQGWGQRYAVILTDGAWARPELAIERARSCHEADIGIFAVGFGAADSTFLAQIASSAEQGVLVNMNRLVEAFSTIAQEIDPSAESEIFPE